MCWKLIAFVIWMRYCWSSYVKSKEKSLLYTVFLNFLQKKLCKLKVYLWDDHLINLKFYFLGIKNETWPNYWYKKDKDGNKVTDHFFAPILSYLPGYRVQIFLFYAELLLIFRKSNTSSFVMFFYALGNKEFLQ